MANDDAASSARSRLTRKRPPERLEPPEFGLARSLLRTEYAVRGRRAGGGTRSGSRGSAWDQLADELARFIDRLRGRSPAGGGTFSAGGTQEAAGAGQDEPHSARAVRGGPPGPLSAPSMLSSRAAFEGTIARLPPRAREAFEDAVLHLVRTEKKWKKAYDKAPADMPSVAMYANNAYLRELRRNAPPSAEPAARERSTSRAVPPPAVTAEEAVANARNAIMARDRAQFAQLRARWERPAPATEDSVTTSPRSGFDAPLVNDMTDGHGFRETERLSLAERTTGSTVIPRASDTFGGHEFLTAEAAHRGSGSVDGAGTPARGPEEQVPPPLSPPVPVSPLPNPATPVSPLPYPALPVSPAPDPAHLVSPLPSEATPVSPAPGTTLPVSPPSSPAIAHSLLGSEGQQVLRDTRHAFPTASGSRSADPATRAATPAPAPVRRTSNTSTARRA